MLKKSLLLFAGIFIISAIMASETRLLRQPALSDNHLAFAYGGNIWITDLYGGEAKQIPDLLPHMFRHLGICPIVGTTTWGGLIGIWDYPQLIDGGAMVPPRGAF